MIELADSGNLDPTSEEIAAVAGISHRSIYRYFPTRSELLEAAVVRSFETSSTQVFGERRLDGSFDERVEQFVAARIEIYRQLRSIVRITCLQTHHESEALERARSALRERLADCFAYELNELESEERRLTVAIVDAVFQFESLDYLGGSAGLDDASMHRSLEQHLHRHLRRS